MPLPFPPRVPSYSPRCGHTEKKDFGFSVGQPALYYLIHRSAVGSRCGCNRDRRGRFGVAGFKDNRTAQRLMIGKGGTSTHVEALSLGCFQTRDVFDGQVAQYVFESHELW